MLDARPLCPLEGMPPMQRAWSAKRGDVVFLQTRVELRPEMFARISDSFLELGAKTGIEFVLLGPDMSIVPPLPEEAG